MFAVCVLKSERNGTVYIGFTNDTQRRLREHNAGAVHSTSKNAPYEIVYEEWYKDEQEARHREHILKLRGRARHQLLRRIKKSLGA